MFYQILSNQREYQIQHRSIKLAVIGETEINNIIWNNLLAFFELSLIVKRNHPVLKLMIQMN